MSSDLIYLVAFAIISVATPLTMLLTSKTLAPRRPNPVKRSTFECGEIPVGEGHPRFTMQYFAYAIVFTVIDVLAVFLLVFSPTLANLGAPVIVPLLIFIAVMAMALAYVISTIRIR